MARPKNCGRCNKPKTQCNCGRPTKMTEDVIRKLEEAYALDCTDAEATLYAGIGMSTLYSFQKKNPEFVERKEQLKQTPMLHARQSMVEGIKTDPKLALDYARNKRRQEFSTQEKRDVAHSGFLDLKTVLDDLDGRNQGLPSED